MIDLEKKGLKPMIILWSIVLLPCIISLIICLIINFVMTILIITIVILLVYLFIIFICFNIFNKKNKLLKVIETGLEISIYKSGKLIYTGLIKFSEIDYIIYYRVTSITGWFALFNYILPKSAIVVYKKNIQDELLGYMDFKDIKKISNENEIKLLVK